MFAGAAFAQADGKAVQIDIPPQPLGMQLQQLGREANANILFSPEAVSSLRGPALHGTMSAREAILRLIANTPLRLTVGPNGTLIVAELRTNISAPIQTQAPADIPPAASSAPAAVPAAPMPPPATVSTVTVTGSRVITGNNSPTPLTSVSVQQLTATTPSDVPDALNKLPVFAGSRSQATTTGATINGAGNFLNLRDLGTNRTLILLDGMRLPYTDTNGDVDINTLPQALMERVDVVTGGASAVYGSDAVAGVVNFVLNKKYQGFEVEAQAGISDYGDDGSWKAQVIGGTGLFGGRGHVEFSLEHYSSDGIDNMTSRPAGAAIYQELGLGAAASPYFRASGLRNTNLTPGGYIPSGALGGMYFPSNGVIAPFQHGSFAQGVNEIGGDGGYGGEGAALFPGVQSNPWLAASLHRNSLFTRFDYDITDHIHGFIEGNITQSQNYAVVFPQSLTVNLAADNAYLPASAASTLAAAGQTSFPFRRGLMDESGGPNDATTTSFNAIAGLTGDVFNRFSWEAHYLHGESQLYSQVPDNINNQKLYASLDAVTGPSGQPVCRVSLNPTSAALYPGCVPFNPFGPSAESAAAFNYVTDRTRYTETNIMDDVAGSIHGPLFNDWAGPITAALSGEFRNVSLETDSNYSPTAKVNCTGQNLLTCNSSMAIWNNVVSSSPKHSEQVEEGAVEVEAPLLHDLPLAEAVDLNGALRYTQYSISGPATTWKIGVTWKFTDEIKFRGARSRDIRAPNLNNLYAPSSANFSAFTDFLTGVTGNTEITSQGNVNLKPEVSSTTTLGFVYTPRWLPRFSMSVDYYDINIRNVITTVSGGATAIEQICINSGGTSPYCALAVRPFPITNTSAANFPTAINSEPLNTGQLYTHGIDVEADYGLALSDLWERLTGRLSLQGLFSYQPTLKSNTGIPGAPITNQAGAQNENGFSIPSERLTINVGYVTGPFSMNLQERWQGSERNSENPTLVYLDPDTPPIYYTDLGFKYQAKLFGDQHFIEFFANINNVFNQQPHIFIGNGRTGAEGYAYPASYDEDLIGRYFTGGARFKF
ncbi:MAG: TonB-dependent receptor [Caulobacteraceae bacterium]